MEAVPWAHPDLLLIWWCIVTVGFHWLSGEPTVYHGLLLSCTFQPGPRWLPCRVLSHHRARGKCDQSWCSFHFLRRTRPLEQRVQGHILLTGHCQLVWLLQMPPQLHRGGNLQVISEAGAACPHHRAILCDVDVAVDMAVPTGLVRTASLTLRSTVFSSGAAFILSIDH